VRPDIKSGKREKRSVFVIKTEGELPLVSVIVPAFNYGPLIGQTLESLLNQTYSNWECLVIDDGSMDNTPHIVRSYCTSEPRIKYYYQSNSGLSSARNTGIKYSKGRYIQFLDADDLLEKRKLEHHVRYLENNREVEIVYGGVRYFKTESPDERKYSMFKNDKRWMPEVSGAGEDIFTALLYDNIMVVSSPLLRRLVVDGVGYFDTNIDALADWDYWIRCASAGFRFQYLECEETLSLIRWHQDSMSQNSMKMKKQREYIRLKVNRIVSDADALRLKREHLIFWQGQNGVNEIENGELIKGIRYLLKAAYLSPAASTKLKWCYWAALAPFTPRNRFRKVIHTPVTQSASIAFGKRPNLDDS
jgi:glycosyltransferase involved in cell wall biosynthesis